MGEIGSNGFKACATEQGLTQALDKMEGRTQHSSLRSHLAMEATPVLPLEVSAHMADGD